MSEDAPKCQTLTTIRSLLDAAGLAPRKLYGQHFLIDGNLMNKLVEAADLNPTDTVLEVGTGTGSLTALLGWRAGHVITVEIDRKIAEVSAEYLAPFKNITLIVSDALKSKSTISPEVVTTVKKQNKALRGETKLVANLPYDIATSLVIDLLLCDLPICRLCFTVQSEVADRFAAREGTSDYGAVGIIAQSLTTVRRICKVPPAAFWPRPKVDSTMLCLDRIKDVNGLSENPSEFAGFVRSFFLHRRKTLSHLARYAQNPEAFPDAMSRLRIDPKSRPESLSVERWQALYRLVR